MIRILLIFLVQFAAGQTQTQTGPLYPYGPGVGDHELQTDTSQSIELGYSVNFYGRKYNTSYVTKDGFVAFDRDARYEHFIYKDGARDIDKDYPFMAPFYYAGEGITKYYQGKIFYRLVHANTDDTSTAFLSMLQTYMFNSTVGLKQFKPDIALVVTWENVTDMYLPDDGSCDADNISPCKGATFQLVLVACPMNTFVIFNYLKEDIPVKLYYQAGINGGHGVGWTSVCTGCTLNDLPTIRGSDVTGRFIFRVSENNIERGGCTDTGKNLQIYPKIAGMFGGELLDIGGLCIETNAQVKCRFGKVPHTAYSMGFKVNKMRIKCPVPKLKERGLVTVAISTDGGNNYKSQGHIYIVMESQVDKSLILGKGWHDMAPDSLDMTWEPSALTSDPAAKVDIQVIGYRETETDTLWETLTTIESGIDNSGSYSFNVADVQCHPANCDLFEVGVVEVQLQKEFHPLANSRVAMNEGVLLGWYVNSGMSNKYGDNWAPSMCDNWYNKDKADTSWMSYLLHCPCTVDQAIADFGRWLPDLSCSMYSKSSRNCHYHTGAHHCVRSFLPTSTGAGNQCCYSDAGLLMNAGDSYQGSTPDRSHDWGASPYNTPRHVPSLSHWIDDLVSFYYCCLWDEYNNCDKYMELRATRDCYGYQPSESAIAFGDPHIATFDGQMYNFGGKGEYYLLYSDQFKLQGKFELGPQIHANSPLFNSTVLTAVAMEGIRGTKVEIHLAPKGLNQERKLDVFVDGQLKLFDDKRVFKQDFAGGVSVINVANDTVNLHNNFSVLFNSGVGVQVSAANDLIHVIVNLPPSFKNRTQGLMGSWNGVKDDDYTARHGTIVPIASSQQDVFKAFAKTWVVAEVNSDFQHYEIQDESFVPEYSIPAIPAGSPLSRSDLHNTCQGDSRCEFDYVVTGNRDIALASLKAGNWFAELKNFQQPVETCGYLDVPSAEKDNTNYTLGNVVTITGCRNGGSLSGESTYTCIGSRSGGQVWSPPVNAHCEEPTEDAQIGMIVGIVIAVVIIIVIVIIVVVICKRRGGHEKDKKEPETEVGQREAMMSELEKKAKDEDNDV